DSGHTGRASCGYPASRCQAKRPLASRILGLFVLPTIPVHLRLSAPVTTLIDPITHMPTLTTPTPVAPITPTPDPITHMPIHLTTATPIGPTIVLTTRTPTPIDPITPTRIVLTTPTRMAIDPMRTGPTLMAVIGPVSG